MTGIEKAVTTVVTVFILTVGGYNVHTNSKMAEAIKTGNDPMRVSCAYSINDGNKSVCAILAAKSN